MAQNGGARPGAGRKKGQKAAHTLDAAKGKELLIKMYLEKIKPINEALIKKAEEGDIQAIKELHDRVYGRSPQPITGANGGDFVVKVVNYAENNTNTSQISA